MILSLLFTLLNKSSFQMTTYWSETLMPMFREYLRDQYLCDLWFVCDGGALVPCHRLMVTALLGEKNLSILKDCPDEDCYVSLDGWPPEKIALYLEHLYFSDSKATQLDNIFKCSLPNNIIKTLSKDSKTVPSSGDGFNISKKHLKMAKCPNCCKVFSVKYFKKYHLRICGKESESLSCDICKKNSFVSKRTLSNHMRSVHSNEKPFKCEYCKMTFARSETLSKHRFRKHGRNKKGAMVGKNFSCKICEKKLSSSEKLLQHVRVIHHGVRNFQCNYCDKQFSSRFNKDSHESKVHREQEEVITKSDKDSVQYVTHLESVKIVPS